MATQTETRAQIHRPSRDRHSQTRSFLMQFSRIFLLGSGLLAVAACSESDVSKIVTPDASAAIRWVNAVPDTVAMDYRVVDYPSNASEPSLGYGASSGRWRIIPAGSHHVTAFFTNTTAAGDGVS